MAILKQKKVLMIGAGIGQVYLSYKVKERGHYLIVVSIPGNYPAFSIADKCYYENVFDKEKVLEIARNENVDAVISDQNDLMMPTVAYVAEHMGLPGNTSAIINAYCNKNVFRSNCDLLAIPSPKHSLVSDVSIPAEFKDIPFPWMVKPSDSQSSKGVTKVNSLQEYEDAIEKALQFSQTNTAILEEFFEGKEMVAEGFIYDGKYYNLSFADRRYFDLPNMFIPSQTIFPSLAPESIKTQIEEYECKMAKFIHPHFAIVHSEYLYNDTTGEIRIVESALRGGGVYISSHLIPLCTGIDINDVLLDCALSEKTDIDGVLSKKVERSSAYICFYLPEGIVKKVEGMEDISDLPYVHLNEVHNIEVGQESPQMTFKGQRLGPIMVDADSREEIEKRISTIQTLLHVAVASPTGEVCDIKWS